MCVSSNIAMISCLRAIRFDVRVYIYIYIYIYIVLVFQALVKLVSSGRC